MGEAESERRSTGGILIRGLDYIILRERDVLAVAAERLDKGSTGLYL